MVEGPAGIGKSALLAEAARRAAGSGFSVVRAAGAELEQEYPFGVVRQLFARAVGSGGASTGVLEGAASLAGVPLGLTGAVVASSAGTEGAEAAAMHGLYWLAVNLSALAPLLIVVDDAHWGDVMSVRFVSYLARRVEDLPVLLLVAARPVGDGREAELLGQLGALPAVVWFRPGALSQADVGRLVAESGLRGADHQFVAACHLACGGNPYLLGELLAGFGAEGVRGTADDAARVASFTPDGIVRWVQARLRALGKDAERLAFAVAVLGAGAHLADAAAVANVELPDAVDAAETLVAAHILAAEQRYEFVHPIVRASAYAALGRARGAEWHTRAARLWHERGAPLVRVAAQLLSSDPGRDGWVVEALRAAAREAKASGAAGSAASYLERAAAESQSSASRAELLVELGEAQLQAGLNGAAQHMREALDLQEDPGRRAEIGLTLGRALFTVGDYPGAREAFRQGLTERGHDHDDDVALELWGRYVTIAGDDVGVPASTTARLQKLGEDSAAGRTPTERFLLVQLAYQSALNGHERRDQVINRARRALADGALLQDSAGDMAPYGAACYALLASGELDEAIAELSRGVDFSQRQGSPVAFGWFSMLRGRARYFRGDLLEALADLESAESSHSDEYSLGLPDIRALLGLCEIERGDLTAAANALTLPGDEQHWGEQPSFISYLYVLGRLRAARGAFDDALETILTCGRLLEAVNAPNPAASLPWRSEAAILAARLGEPDQATDLIAEDLRRAREFGAPHATGVALRTAGLLQRGKRGIDQLAEAVAVLDPSHFNLELARALIEHGAALRRAQRRRDARQPLRRGLDLAASCGALALAKRAREELLATGARPRREHIRGANALTASELRVARMAADGMSNRQIAQALFITIRTVTTHLGHVYQKLNITGREQLVTKLLN